MGDKHQSPHRSTDACADATGSGVPVAKGTKIVEVSADTIEYRMGERPKDCRRSPLRPTRVAAITGGGPHETRVSPGSRNINRLLVAKGLRAFGDGYVALLLPLYLLDLGFSPLQVGIVATTTLFGSGVLTLLVGPHADRYHVRTLLLAGTVLMGGSALGSR